MGAFNNLTYGQYVPTYVGNPTKEVDELGQVLETRYYANRDKTDQLQAMAEQIEVRDINQPILQNALSQLKDNFIQFEESGNWEDADNTVRSAAKQLAGNRELKGAIEDQGRYQAWKSELDERFKKGEINKDQYNYSIAKAQEGNQEALTYDPSTGTYQNMFSAGKPSADMSSEIVDYTNEVAKMYKASTVDNPIAVEFTDKDGKVQKKYLAYGSSKTGTPPGYFDVQTKEYISQQEVKAAMMRSIMANPSYRAYLEESADIEAWKQEQRKGGQISILDIYNPSDSFGSMLNRAEMAAMIKEMEKQGVDFSKFVSDPLLVKSLYRRLKMNETVNDMIEAPSSAVSYEKINHKFLKDIQFEELLKHRNRLAEIAARGREARKTAKAKEEYEKPPIQPLVIKNQGPVIKNNEYDLKTNAKIVEEKKARLAELKNELEKNRRADSKNNYSKLNEEYQRLKNDVAIQENQIRSGIKFFYETEDGEKYMREGYDEYKKFSVNQFAGEELEPYKNLTYEEFKERVIDSDLQTPNDLLTRLSKVFTMGESSDDRRVMYNDPDQFRDYIVNLKNRVLQKTNVAVKEADDEFPGMTGNSFDNPDEGQKSAIYRKMNDAKTDYYMGNKTGYYTLNKKGNNVTALDWEQEAIKQSGLDPNKTKVIVTSSDAEHSINGVALFPDKVALVDDKGNTIAENWIYPIDGGADERLQVGMNGRRQFSKGTSEYEDATKMAATAMFSNIIPEDLNKESAYVTQGSKAVYESSPYEVPHSAGTKAKFYKRSQPYYDDNGVLKGYDVVWEVGLLNEEGEIENFAPNTNYMQEAKDGGFKWKTGVDPADGKNYQFKNLNDARISLFRMNVNEF